MSKDQRRFMAIPFSSSCRSGSSVDVVDPRHGKKPQQDGAPANKPKGESLVARLLKGFKNLSQIFAVYEEDEEEEEEREMVIGLPTDVKHVAHIGWDGSTNTAPSVRSWNRGPAASTSSAAAPAAPPPLSMRQFELAMAAQAAAGTGASPSAAAASRHGHS